MIAVNRPVSEELARALHEQFVEVLFAPGYDDAGLEVLRGKGELRILEDRERRKASPGERDFRRVLGGVLVQDRDTDLDDRDAMRVVSEAAPDERGWGDLLFAWRLCKYVRSNAIVIARDLASVGIGAGQTSRVDAVRLAVEKAGDRASGAALASDAFFPFDDGPRAAVAAGVKAIIQPGGSKRDDEVIAAAERAGRGHGVHRPPPLPALAACQARSATGITNFSPVCVAETRAVFTSYMPASRPAPSTIASVRSARPFGRITQIAPSGAICERSSAIRARSDASSTCRKTTSACAVVGRRPGARPAPGRRRRPAARAGRA